MRYTVLALVLALVLTGCGGPDRKAQRQLRDSGIEKLSAGDYTGAEKDFSKALSMAGGRVTDAEIDIVYYLGATYTLQDNYNKAISRYSDLITYDEDNKDAYFLRGSSYLNIEEKDKGIADYRKATAIAPGDYELAIAVYENLVAMGYKNDAAEFLNKALEIEGDEADNFFYRGRIYQLLGQDDLAKTAFIRAMEDGNDEAGIYLAEVFAKEGDKKSAKELADRYGGKENPDQRQSMITGRLFLSLGEYKKAAKVYEDALTADEDGKGEYHQELLKGQIAVYEYGGDFKKALKAAQEYVGVYPSDSGMIREIEFLKTR